MTPYGPGGIRAFIMDEVERQGWKRYSSDFWFRVGAMMAAWNDALILYRDGPYPEDRLNDQIVERWGAMVEPEQNRRGFRICRVRVGINECPDGSMVRRLMGAWSGALRDDVFPHSDDAYVEFEKIHPFIDGNGRVGKIIHNYLMGTLENPVLVKDYFGGGIP